jgi:hypothetical protein
VEINLLSSPNSAPKRLDKIGAKGKGVAFNRRHYQEVNTGA